MKFKKYVSLIMAAIMCLMLIIPTSYAASNETPEIEQPEYCDEFVEVFSYRTILQEKYDSKVFSGEIDPSDLSFEDFCETYIDASRTLDHVTADNVEDVQKHLEFQAQPCSSSSKDGKYILKGINDPNSSSFDPSYTPSSAFQRSVQYADRSLYSLLREGDIVLETNNTDIALGSALNNPGHTAYIYNPSKSGAYGSYIQTIEAVPDSVQFGFLDDARMITFGVVILRPKNTSNEIVKKASQFHYKQLNKPYHFSLTEAKTDINSTQWYCSELTNAAYYYAGVNFNAVNSAGNVMPYDILHSSMLSYIRYGKYLDIRISKTYGVENGYTIEVYNNTGSTVTIEYNSKTCWEGDAKGWSNLKDIKTVSLGNGNMTRINIYTNGLANSVAISYVSNGTRFITYGDQLRSGSYLMAVYKLRLQV